MPKAPTRSKKATERENYKYITKDEAIKLCIEDKVQLCEAENRGITTSKRGRKANGGRRL